MIPLPRNLPCIAVLMVFISIVSFPVLAAQGENEAAASLSDAEKAQALSHFQKGQAQFAEKEYLLAVEHFKAAYDITGSPEILYNIAMCYEEQHENEQALAYYREYLKDARGKDAEEVRQRIQALGGDDAALPADASTEDEPGDHADDIDESGELTKDGNGETERRLHHFSMELDMGPGFVLMTPDTGIRDSGLAEPEKRNYFSMDILGHFFLNDWFAISGALLIGPYMKGDKSFIGGDPTRHLGLGVGIGMQKKINPRTSIFTNLLVVPCAIWREDWTRRATWIAFDARVGMHIHLTESWDVNLLAVAEGGPAFVIHPRSTDWDNGVLLSVGPRIGFTYTHRGK